MKILIFISALAVSALAQPFVPVHGCEWVPQSTAIRNFTYSHSASNTSAPAFVQWKAPALGVACYVSSTGSANSIGKPSTTTTVPCTAPASDPTSGMFEVSADGGNATLRFVVYEQCAADIFEFFYEAVVALNCVRDEGGSGTCVDGGNAMANVTGEAYLPPIRPGPPPSQWM